MIEIAEGRNLERQARAALKGKTIVKVVNATSPHKFCWYHGDPENYGKILTGRKILDAKGHGMHLDLILDGAVLVIGDGTNMRYCTAEVNRPEKHQLLLELDDGGFLVFTVAMYGGIWASEKALEGQYYTGSLNSVSPLSDAFDFAHFEKLFSSVKKDLSAKAFLATEQRIPGLGNGSLQDILLVSSVHPKRKISTLSDIEKRDLLSNLKAVLADMAERGGRDTEKDLFGNFGKYKTLLSRNTFKDPCPLCGDKIVKDAYMGGAIYYCPTCQKL